MPVAVGVPLMMPVALLIVSPGGNPVADQLYAVVPPDAVMGVSGYVRLTVQLLSVAGAVIVGNGLMSKV